MLTLFKQKRVYTPELRPRGHMAGEKSSATTYYVMTFR